MRHVEHHSLEEEHERDPLIVGLDLNVIVLGVVGPHSGVRDPVPDVALVVYVVLRDGERPRDVAVRLDDILGDGAAVKTVDYAVGA